MLVECSTYHALSCSGQRRLTVYFQHTILRLMLRICREDELIPWI